MFGERIGSIGKIAVAPIKSAGLVELATAVLTPSGLQGDREYVVVQANSDDDGVHPWVSQRDKHEGGQPQSLGILAKIWPQVSPGILGLSWEGEDLLELDSLQDVGTPMNIRIWNDVFECVDQGDQVAKWLSDHLNHPVRLVRTPRESRRGVSQKWQQNQNLLAGQDSYPFNWFSDASLKELNRLVVGEAITWQRFRPSVVVSGSSQSGIEHVFFQGTFGEVSVVNAKPSDKCPVPMVREDGSLDCSGEPLRTLNSYRRWRKPDGKVFVIFGEGALPQSSGTISVGDEVTMTERRAEKVLYGGLEIKPQRKS